MQTIGNLVADAREREATLFATPGPTDHSYEAFLTTAWKAGNLLRHYGVRAGDAVAVVVGPAEPDDGDEPGWLGTSPTPLLAVFGGLLAGASVTLDPVTAVEVRALVAPTAWLDRYTPGPGTKPIGYGEQPADPTVAQFERESWSENPVAPPVDLDPTTTAVGGSHPLAHGDLLAETRRIVDEYGLGAGDRVGIDAPVTPGAFVAGVLAPLSTGGTVVLGSDDPASDLDLVVTTNRAESTDVPSIDPTAVFPDPKN